MSRMSRSSRCSRRGNDAPSITSTPSTPSTTSGVNGYRRLTLEILVEEGDHGRVALDFVFLLHEAVALVLEDDVLDGDTVLLRCRHDLVGLDLQHPRVVRALKDHQWRLDLVGVEQR